MPDRDFDPKQGGFTRIMNELIDKLIEYGLDRNEYKLVFLVIRVTWSIKGQPWGILRWKYMMKKTKLSDSSLRHARLKLIARNILHTKFTSNGSNYKINSKVSTWIPEDQLRPIWRRGIPQPVAVENEGSLQQPVAVVDSNPLREIPQPVADIPIKENYKENSLKKTTKGNGGDLVQKPIKLLTFEEQMEEDANTVLDYLNQTSGKGYSFSCDNLAPIINILKNGHNLEECLTVCERKWLDSSFSNVYFRPSTLFNPSYFERYLNETGSKSKPTSKADERREKNAELMLRRQNARRQEQQKGKD